MELKAQRRRDTRTVNGFVAARRPAGALLHAHRVIRPSDQYLASSHPLEMALQAKIGVARRQQLGVDRAMSGVTGRAAFARGFVFENVRPTLGRMAAQTTFIFREQCITAPMNGALVRRMTVRATQFSFGHGMVGRQIELSLNIEVALVANRVHRTRGLDREPCAVRGKSRPARSKAVRRLHFAARFRM